jgi:hypothetical protein
MLATVVDLFVQASQVSVVEPISEVEQELVSDGKQELFFLSV